MAFGMVNMRACPPRFEQSDVDDTSQSDTPILVRIGCAVAKTLLHRCNREVSALGQPVSFRSIQGRAHLGIGKIGAVGWRSRLLTPGVRKRASVESIQPGLIDQRHGDLAIALLIRSHRDGDPVG